jgi:hypothetical protein
MKVDDVLSEGADLPFDDDVDGGASVAHQYMYYLRKRERVLNELRMLTETFEKIRRPYYMGNSPIRVASLSDVLDNGISLFPDMVAVAIPAAVAPWHSQPAIDIYLQSEQMPQKMLRTYWKPQDAHKKQRFVKMCERHMMTCRALFDEARQLSQHLDMIARDIDGGT